MSSPSVPALQWGPLGRPQGGVLSFELNNNLLDRMNLVSVVNTLSLAECVQI